MLIREGIRQVRQLLRQSNHLGRWWVLVLGRDLLIVMLVMSVRRITRIFHVHVIEAEIHQKCLVRLRGRKVQSIFNEVVIL